MMASGYINAGQFTTSTTSAEAVARRTARDAVTLKNTDATITIYVGEGTVTAANGMPLLAGESIRLETLAAINAISASGTPVLAFIEEF